MSVWPYINPDIRYVGVSYLRQLNQDALEKLRHPVVLKKESGEELAVLVPWETFLALQDAAAPRAAGGQRERTETWTAQVTPGTCDGKQAKSVQFFVSDQFADWDVVYVTVSAAPPPASLRAEEEEK